MNSGAIPTGETHRQSGLGIQPSLFNDANQASLNSAITAVTQLVGKTLGSVEQPFSGISPAQLAKEFRAVDLEQPLDDLGAVLQEISRLYLRDAVYFHHPDYLAHLNPPVLIESIAAELLQAAFNTAVDTWDQSGGATLIEQKLVDWTLSRIGFEPGKADGVFTSGGTQSNLMGMLLARDHYCEAHFSGHRVQTQGLPLEAAKFRIFTSSVSHFSIQKSAALLGLGFDAVIPVAVDTQFRMDPRALAAALLASRERGEIPIAVVATMGTTDFGSIDPIEDISALCRQYQLWLHADAAYGCGLLVSEKYRSRIEGIDLADSVTVDYHKSFLQPVACSAFIARNHSHLDCITYHADYLNPLSQSEEGTPNLVCKSLQTTRRFDALKLWFSLRRHGASAIGDAFTHVIDMAAAVYHRFAEEQSIEFAQPPQMSTLVFRYTTDNPQDIEQQNRINSSIRKTLTNSGRAMIASTKIDGCVYLKFTLLNPSTELEAISSVLETIISTGDALGAEEKMLNAVGATSRAQSTEAY
ncbi:pyridoxal-dependent decarboxylase [Microbulbifer agarilyticus]|uniref:Pyridoxal-dependent decarboxylase n=2 Tax=Microbulbifer agarilyticus TaxID=260552 RepID=A0A1Q2M135_9GAMM|nr:pyridoxal-dependent decarboxylase [Microbulbifer agarilyticus]